MIGSNNEYLVGGEQLSHRSTHTVMMIEMTHAVRVRMCFGKCRNENNTSKCGNRQDFRDTIHGETLQNDQPAIHAGACITPTVDMAWTVFARNF